MSQVFTILELLILSITLIVTVYLSYKSNVIQRQVATSEALNEFRVLNHELCESLEGILGMKLRSGLSVDLSRLVEIEQDNDNRQRLLQFLNHYEGVARGGQYWAL